MVRDAELGMFDLIITKEISRFARNTLDSIQYTRQLLSSGVGVLFQNDNINTFDEDSELRLMIMASIAQDELRKHSNRVKFGHKQAIKNGVRAVRGSMDKRLVVHEPEAEMVRELFERYASGEYSLKGLAKLLEKGGYRTRIGTLIAPQTLAGVISNPRYKGYYVGGKTRSIDLFSKKFETVPPEMWTVFKDESGEIVPQIVLGNLKERGRLGNQTSFWLPVPQKNPQKRSLKLWSGNTSRPVCRCCPSTACTSGKGIYVAETKLCCLSNQNPNISRRFRPESKHSTPTKSRRSSNSLSQTAYPHT